MKHRLVLAVDLGTTNCKAILVDDAGAISAKAVAEYPLAMPQPGWAEQDPALWWETACGLIRRLTAECDPGSIEAIGLTGQMHGLVALDSRREVVRPAILWNDQRSAPCCSAITARAGGLEGLLGLTGNAMLPGYVGGKLLWLKENEPRSFDRVDKVLLPKDYLRYRLCGDVATDFSDASGTGLFDVRNRRWSDALLAKIGLHRELLPPCRAAAETAGTVTADVAERLGVPRGTPVITGGGDAVMQTVGAGSIRGDVVSVVIGTGGNVTVTIDQPGENPDGTLQLFCHALERRWVLMGVSVTAGSSLRWFRDTCAGLERAIAPELRMDPYDLLGREAAAAPPGSNGLLFIPYLQGERCPHTDAEARGSWLGLSLGTRRQDLVRSVMEGVGYSLFSILDLMSGSGVRPRKVHASGGGSANALWRQILADIMNREVLTLEHSADASALGSALLAGVRAGFWSSPEEAVALIKVRTTEQPNAENAALYASLYGVYRKQYAVLKQTHHELRAIFAPPGA